MTSTSPDWVDLIAGFPWDDLESDEALMRCEKAASAGLLVMLTTEPDSGEREEYGEYVYRLTEQGRRALPTQEPVER